LGFKHSPDDDESSQNGQSSSATAHNHSELEEVTLANLDDANKERTGQYDENEHEGPIILTEQQHSIVRGASEKTLDRFEEVRTIASSDIEVMRQMDDW
jgi:hypothetical protein